MQSSRILLLVAALALFGAGALITRALFHSPPPKPAATAAAPVEAPPPQRQVLVARVDMSAGQFLEEGDFAWAGRPENTLRPEFYLQGADSVAPLIGAVLLRPLRAGEAITRTGVVSPRERGFLAAVLPPDMRSISVAVDEVAGNAGLIFPGDRVDMIVTHSDPKAIDPARQVMGQIVLENLRVLAVDQALRGPSEEAGTQTKASPAAGVTGAIAQSKRGAARTVTLEVSPRDAGKVAVAVNLGRVTLALRSLAQEQTEARPRMAANETVVWAGDVMQSLSALRPVTEPGEPLPVVEGVQLLRGGGH